MTNESKFHKKPFTMIGAFVFLIVGVLHALRIIFHATIVIAGFDIPQWPSYLGAIVGIFLSFMLWRENLR